MECHREISINYLGILFYSRTPDILLIELLAPGSAFRKLTTTTT